MASNGGGLLENIITLLFIIFFFSGFFRRGKGKKPGQNKKKPYKPIFPPKEEEQPFEQKRMVTPRPVGKKPDPDTLKGIFAEVLDQLGDKMEDAPKRAEPEAYGDSEAPTIWTGQPEADSRNIPAASTHKAYSHKKKIKTPPRVMQEPATRKKSEVALRREVREAEHKRSKDAKSTAARVRKAHVVKYVNASMMLHSKSGLKTAIIMAEILGKPVALRDGGHNII